MLTQANTTTSKGFSLNSDVEESDLQSSFANDRIMNILVYIRRSTATAAEVMQVLIVTMR